MISSTPEWLPRMASVEGDVRLVVRSLFTIFELDFVVAQPRLHDMPVWWDRQLTEFEGVQCCLGYRHLITREDDNCVRQFDPLRAARMPWCKPMITNTDNVDVRVWRRLEPHKRTMIYVWLEHYDYVAVLEERQERIGTIAFLTSAYHIDGNSKRRSLQKKWEDRVL